MTSSEKISVITGITGCITGVVALVLQIYSGLHVPKENVEVETSLGGTLCGDTVTAIITNKGEGNTFIKRVHYNYDVFVAGEKMQKIFNVCEYDNQATLGFVKHIFHLSAPRIW